MKHGESYFKNFPKHFYLVLIFKFSPHYRIVWHFHNEDAEFGAIKNLFIQEPENDPRKTCWLWQCAQNQDLVQLELYSLDFQRRDYFKIDENTRRAQYSRLRQGTFLLHELVEHP